MKFKKSKLSESGVCIIDDQGTERYLEGILARLNNDNNSVKFEIVEEEKEMTKYVEVTKLIDWSRDPELLEVGKVHKIVEYKESLYIKGVSIYVNEENQSYYLRSDQFKYVEGPVAEIKVDILATLEAKIEQLREEEYNLFEKKKKQIALKSKNKHFMINA